MVDTQTNLEPVKLLRDFEARALAAAAALPEASAQAQNWRGIGFRVEDVRLIVEMADVREVLHLPRVARVPGTKSWLSGLSSLRGELLPVADLRAFLTGQASEVGRDSRVLVVAHDQMMVGLAIEEVFGLQQFASDTLEVETDDAPSWIEPYLTGCFEGSDETWLVFDVHALLRSVRFMQAAA